MKKLVKTILDEGVEMYYRWDDKYIGQRMALGKYEPYLTKLILREIEANKVLVDVGANIGYYSLLAAKKGAKVWAIEPEKENFEILRKNVEENGFENKIRLIKAAAGNKEGGVKIKKSRGNYGGHKIEGGVRGKIRMIKLDDLITDKVDVIKIDVEGKEAEVVAGAKKLIKKWKPTIFFEYGTNTRNRELIGDLSKIYGGIYAIDEYCQTYGRVDEKGLKKFEGNLMAKKNIGWEWGQIKDLRVKKWIKKNLRYNRI